MLYGWTTLLYARRALQARLDAAIQLASPQCAHARRVLLELQPFKHGQQPGAAVFRQAQPAAQEGAGRAGL